VIAFAAIDLRGGRVVQLVGGRPEDERISLPDPAAVARRWIDTGFTALHVVDLDGALGTGRNGSAISAILELAGGHGALVQVGGGVRDDETAAALLDAGAARVIAGTRAIEEPSWLEALAAQYPDRVVVAADVRGTEVVSRGWTERSGVRITELLARLEGLPIAGVLVTDVDREGSMSGADASRFRGFVGATRHPLLAAGGIASERDLRALADAGAAGAVLGMALYTGAVDGYTAARAYAGTTPAARADTGEGG